MSRLVWSVLLGTAVLGGCEQFAARSDIAASAGSHELTAERVSTIMTQSGGGPTVQAAEFIANLWLDYSLFARAVADKQVPTDSAEINEVLWPTLATIKVNLWRDTVRARRFQLTPASVDSAYNSDDARIFQHIIVIPTGPTAADTAAARRTIATALTQVRGGKSFGELAAEISADGSKQDEGYLPFGPRGQFVPEFEDVAWKLAPGEISDVVTTQFGYHLIRRPPLSEARSRVEAGVVQGGSGKTDSLYLEELAKGANLEVAGGAAAAMKAAALSPDDVRNSSKAIVKMKGGDVTLADFVRWTAMFPLQGKMQIRNANDTLLTGFARELGLRELILRAADSAGLTVEPQMMQFAHVRYDQMVTQLRTELGLDTPELSDTSSLSADARLKLASDKVEEFFGRLLDGRAQMVVMPPELGDYLRGKGKGKVNQAGLARAVELASAQRARDSTAAAGQSGAPAPGAVQTAPGGPPIGGETPPAPPGSN